MAVCLAIGVMHNVGRCYVHKLKRVVCWQLHGDSVRLLRKAVACPAGKDSWVSSRRAGTALSLDLDRRFLGPAGRVRIM